VRREATALPWLAWFKAFQSFSGRNQDFLFTPRPNKRGLASQPSPLLSARMKE
jgi:hypothetical protein